MTHLDSYLLQDKIIEKKSVHNYNTLTTTDSKPLIQGTSIPKESEASHKIYFFYNISF